MMNIEPEGQSGRVISAGQHMREDDARTTRPGLTVALALVLACTGVTATALASGGNEPDQANGFTPKLLAPHAGFADDVTTQFRLRYADAGGNPGAIVSNLPDAGTVVIAEVTWEPNGSSGWHTHPGMVVVSIVEGALAVTNADDCVTRTYSAGEAWVDPGQGNVHVAVNPSDTNETIVYATFFGVPDGEPATVHVPAVDC